MIWQITALSQFTLALFNGRIKVHQTSLLSMKRMTDVKNMRYTIPRNLISAFLSLENRSHITLQQYLCTWKIIQSDSKSVLNIWWVTRTTSKINETELIIWSPEPVIIAHGCDTSLCVRCYWIFIQWCLQVRLYTWKTLEKTNTHTIQHTAAME